MAWNKTTGIVGYMFLLLPEIVDNIFQPFLLCDERLRRRRNWYSGEEKLFLFTRYCLSIITSLSFDQIIPFSPYFLTAHHERH